MGGGEEAPMTADMGGLYPAFRNRVNALLHDPDAIAMGVTVVSAFRSDAKQAELFAAAVKKYGSKSAARKWVAPPGHSNHGPRVDAAGKEPGPFGVAVDFGVRGVHALSGQWPQTLDTRMRDLGRKYGLKRPMAWEDWHYEFDPTTRTRWDGGAQPTTQEEDDMADPAVLKVLNDISAHLTSIDNRLANIEDITARWGRKNGYAKGPIDERSETLKVLDTIARKA
jgi:hypothetical protein